MREALSTTGHQLSPRAKSNEAMSPSWTKAPSTFHELPDILPPGTVDLWLFDVATLSSLSPKSCGQVLSPDEIMRAQRLRSAAAARHFEVGRYMIREAIARYLNKSASDVDFAYGVYGKPLLPGIDLHVSWSHAGSRWALALAKSGSVGVDIELEANAEDWSGPASISFSTSEISYVIAESDPGYRKRRFLNVWTRKEAVLKACGKGLHDSMSGISTFNARGIAEEMIDLGSDGRWWLREFFAGEAVVGALAAAYQPEQIRFIDGAALAARVVGQSTPMTNVKSCLVSDRVESLP